MAYSMYELIGKQKRGEPLGGDEIGFLVHGVTDGSIPDYQCAAWLMAVCLRGMSQTETLLLTQAMARSGGMNDLSSLPGVKVDKHSTGGVGDKTTLITAPLAAACGLTVAKMSGRGLGHTGGTIDKLEAIPGLRTEWDSEDFRRIVTQTGVCVAAQSGDLAPADKRLYALRDVTATVDSIPLIAASVMSKKLAAGADCIVLDVKTGGGAFMKTTEEAFALAKTMVDIGQGAGREVSAVVTDMNRPLGFAVGNALEVTEAWELLDSGGEHGDGDLTELCLCLTAELLVLASKRSPGQFPESREECRALALRTLQSGRAAERFACWIKAQGGDMGAVERGLPMAAVSHEWCAPTDGYIQRIDTEAVGMAALRLGAGRRTMVDAINPGAGLVFCKKPGDKVQKGEVLATLYAGDKAECEDAEAWLTAHTVIGGEPPEAVPLVYGMVSVDTADPHLPSPASFR